jgi:ATP-dependent DNA helicase RecG
MKLKELKNLVAGGENERVEFKATTGQRTQAGKTVCGLLNNLGGFVVFGVTDKGDIVGQKLAAGTLESIAAELRKIEPPAFPDIATVPLKKDLAAIVLTVSGGSGPYTFDGRPYLRHGPTTIIMPREEYEHRLVERLHGTRRWENEPVAEGVAVEDLDAEEIQITMDNAVRLGRLEATDRRDVESILRGL